MRIEVLKLEDKIGIYRDGHRIYELRNDGSLLLLVSKKNIKDIRKRIPETKNGLDVYVFHEDHQLIKFNGVKKIDRFEGRKYFDLDTITDNGETTFIDWVKNRKKYEYTIWLR